MKRLIFMILIIIGNISYAGIRLRIYEPIRFKPINTTSVGDTVVGEGSIEIFSDDLETDKNKKFVFKFPKKGLMTNKKRWLEIDKYMMEDSDRVFKMTREKKIVKIFAIINKRKLNDIGVKAEDLQGEYVGYVPIIVEQYGVPRNKVDSSSTNKPMLLPEL